MSPINNRFSGEYNMARITYQQLQNKELLQKLYWQDNLTSREISKLLNTGDHCNVLRQMKKFGIIRRKNIVKPQYLKYGLNLEGLKDTDFAYIAGIIDGEGYISIGKSFKNLTIEIANTDKDLMYWIASIFNTKIKTRYFNKSNRNTVHIASVRRHIDIIQILKLVLPYLRIKKKKAINALSYLEKKITYCANLSTFQWRAVA